MNLFGNASIGVYSLATERMVIVPPQTSESKVRRLEEWLNVRAIRTTVGESSVIGALACANSNGIILPHLSREKEINAIRSTLDLNIAVMKTRKTAYGNLVLTNDRGAAIDPRLKRKDVKKISDTLGVEAVPAEIAGSPCVGALAAATNKGLLAHPLLKEEERKVLADISGVPVDVGTINCGIPYVATGLVGNRRGVVVGSLTTGPELFIIGNALNVVEENG